MKWINWIVMALVVLSSGCGNQSDSDDGGVDTTDSDADTDTDSDSDADTDSDTDTDTDSDTDSDTDGGVDAGSDAGIDEEITGHYTCVTAGDYHSIGIMDDGTVRAWGWGPHGQLGDGTATTSFTPVQVLDVDGEGYLTDVIQIAAGAVHSIALKSDGTVIAWGANTYGQLGDDTDVAKSFPVQVLDVGGEDYLTDVVQIAAGEEDSFAVKSDGSVVAWGRNFYGQIGNNTLTDCFIPVRVLGVGGSGYLEGVIQVATGNGTSIALRYDGTVFAWGKNGSGVLGNDTTADSHTPVQVLGVGGIGYLSGVVQVAVDAGHSMALKSDGTVLSWGNNIYGEVGDGTIINSHTPMQVLGVGGVGYLSGIVQIAIEDYNSLALRGDGTVLSWGFNSYGQIGDGTNETRLTPVQVLTPDGDSYLDGIVQVAGGASHSLSVASSGVIYGWGNDYYGQLGNGDDDVISQLLPIMMP